MSEPETFQALVVWHGWRLPGEDPFARLRSSIETHPTLSFRVDSVEDASPPAHRTSIRRDDLAAMTEQLAEAHRAFADIFKQSDKIEVRRICAAQLKVLASWRDAVEKG